MIDVKTLTLDDLKRDYSTRHGFTFQVNSVCDINKVQQMADALITGKITTSHPEFVVQLQPNLLVFVYGEGISFKSGEFFNKVNGIGSAMGLWQVDTLMGYVHSH